MDPRHSRRNRHLSRHLDRSRSRRASRRSRRPSIMLEEPQRSRRESHFVDIPMMGEPPVASKLSFWYWVVCIAGATVVISGLIIYSLPKNPLGSMTAREFDSALNDTMEGTKAQLSQAISAADILRLEKEMNRWKEKGLLPHQIIQNNLGMSVSNGVKAQHRVNYLLHEAKTKLTKQDCEIPFLMMLALVKSATPINVEEFIKCLTDFFGVMHKDVTNYAKQCGGKFNANALAKYVDNNIRGLQAVVSRQRDLDIVPELCKIIETEWGDISQKSKKPTAPAKFKQDPVALIAENAKHDITFKTMCKGYVNVIGVGANIPAEFKQFMKGSEGFRLAMNGYKTAPVKGIPRVMQKFFYGYGSNATKIVDIIRCSFVFDSIKELYCGLNMGIKYFVDANKRLTPSLTTGDCVWLKDRFKKPLANGYRDIILMVRVPGTDIWAETQFHLKDVIDYKNKHQHKMYELLRHFPNSGEIQNAIVENMESRSYGGSGRHRSHATVKLKLKRS